MLSLSYDSWKMTRSRGVWLAVFSAALLLATGFTWPAAGSPARGSYAVDTHWGREFWVAYPSALMENQIIDEMYITSKVGANVTVTVPGTGWSQSIAVAPGDSSYVQIPVVLDIGGENTRDEITKPNGVHVVSDQDITVFVMHNEFHAGDGYLALPVTCLGTAYMVESYPSYGTSPQRLTVLAVQDGTTVTITPTTPMLNHPADTPYTVNLNAGDVYEIQDGTADHMDISGTTVWSDRAVAVYQGECVGFVPGNGIWAANTLIEQALPISEAGTAFFVTPSKERNVDRFRCYGLVDGTTVSVNGTPVAVLGIGGVYEGEFATAQAITSDQGIMVAQFAVSENYDPTSLGDPNMITVPNTGQYLNDYQVVTPSQLSGFLYHSINVVAPSVAVGDLTFDGVPVTGFQPIGNTGYVWVQIDSQPGPHHLETPITKAEFAVSLYGFSEFDAYGFIGGIKMNPQPIPPIGALRINPPSVVGPAPATGQIFLTFGAPAGGLTVTLHSSNSAVAGVPATVTIPEGSGTATFPISTTVVTTSQVASISATTGSSSKTASLTVNPNTVTSLSLNPQTVASGGTSQATVTLAAAAPPQGTIVQLHSGNPAISTVPATVTVLSGHSQATFAVPTKLLTSSSTTDISATLNGTTRHATLTVIPVQLVSFTLSNGAVFEGATVTGTLTLNGPAQSGGAPIKLTNTNPAVAVVPATVTVPQGAISKTFTFTTKPTLTIIGTTITASWRSATLSQMLTVTPITLSGLDLLQYSAVGGTVVTGAVRIPAAAPAGGYKVALVSSNTSVATVPATITIPANGTSASFSITTKPVAGTSFANITAAHGSSTLSKQLQVLPPEVSAFTITPATTKGGKSLTGKVILTGKAPTGGLLITIQSNPALVTVTTPVKVAAGATTASFSLKTATVSYNTTVSVSARALQVTKTASVILTP